MSVEQVLGYGQHGSELPPAGRLAGQQALQQSLLPVPGSGGPAPQQQQSADGAGSEVTEQLGWREEIQG